MDHYFLESYDCVFPHLTNNSNATNCIVEKTHKLTWFKVLMKHLHDFCPAPCETMKVNFAGHDNSHEGGHENETYVKFYIKDQIQVKKSHFRYSEVSLLAEVGGYVGLLLGVSLMDIASLFDKVFVIVNQKLLS